MPNNDTTHRTELPKIVDDGTNNNDGEWEMKSYHKLCDWNLWKYINGPTSLLPVIPPLWQTVTHHSVDNNGTLASIQVPGNAAEHEQAIMNAEPWMAGNNTALAKIISAVPSHQLHLVKCAKYAKQAWDSLCLVYQPRNSLWATTIKGQIMAYCCNNNMDIALWLTDMQHLYNSLCDLDTDRMTDHEFALAILDFTPQDDGWRDFVSGLWMKVCNSDTQQQHIDSISFITAICEEYWYQHKDDYHTTSHIFSARYEAQKRNNNQKCSWANDPKNTSMPDKCTYREQSNKLCTNTSCGTPHRHDTSDCIFYKGAKEGQYGDWWRGAIGQGTVRLEGQTIKDNQVFLGDSIHIYNVL
jgi:hypothetical protein